ncbi:Uncharacterised protein [Starkeya nomas]|uniref:Uncharacterized protein n=1 Tax=Starkeya nomas TaxID=2666134 RepID=A0A5S9P1C8_9HYPH|nr:Uncharacterised protein [Starkeya nomas]
MTRHPIPAGRIAAIALCCAALTVTAYAADDFDPQT